ncbi:histidine phosphatase superfamily [Aspergillus pseudoustus]|uniref:Phytase A n=1 Tax=Aspergillus pseudoustus TaxID=1810923 RepID=A0ABR4J7B5_9EURO
MRGLSPHYKNEYPGWGRRGPGRSRLTFFSIMALMMLLLTIIHLLSSVSAAPPVRQNQPCNSIDNGYQCFTQVSQLWGQYSPYFSLERESTISLDVPSGCEITFAQVLSRHGSRYPTESKSVAYAKLIKVIKSNGTSFTGKYAFLKSYNYTLGADDLTTFGEKQMIDSGAKFYSRYKALAKKITPFIRASGSDRVIVSAEKFIEGFQSAKRGDGHSRGDAATVNVVIPEGDGFNNTLDSGTCTVFENDDTSSAIKDNFIALITPPIRKRLEADLPGVKLTGSQVIYLMDMCSFDTVATTTDGSELSPFCNLFSEAEWVQYDYLQSLDKYYGHGAGSSLGPAQGIGFTNELIARLTQSSVHDHTNTNQTLDSNPATFPLDTTLYADFSHDNNMISVFFAMGLYNGTVPLSKNSVESIAEMDGYAASWAVPFGARAYFEMMQCRHEHKPLVRVLINDRVVPLHGCDVDQLGRCKLDDWVRGLSFARSGGNWKSCFA